MESRVFISMTPSELKDLFKQSYLEIKEESQKIPTPEKFLSRQEVAEQFRVTVQTIHSWTKNGRLPYKRIGRRIFYRMSDIENAMQSFSKYKKGA